MWVHPSACCLRPQTRALSGLYNRSIYHLTAMQHTIGLARKALPSRQHACPCLSWLRTGLFDGLPVLRGSVPRCGECFPAARYLEARPRGARRRPELTADDRGVAGVRHGRRGGGAVGALPGAVDGVAAAVRAHQGALSLLLPPSSSLSSSLLLGC